MFRLPLTTKIPGTVEYPETTQLGGFTDEQKEKYADLIRIPETNRSFNDGGPRVAYKIALWNGHEFETPEYLVNAEYRNIRIHFVGGQEYEQGLMYYPIDPRIRESDVKGAIRAYPNSDNTGWLFSHCDDDFHHDHEVLLRSKIVGLFQNEIDQRLISALSASTSQRALSNRIVLNNLINFRNKVVDCAIKEARDRHIGWYHQNPEDSLTHKIILDCINTSLTDETPGSITSNITNIKALLVKHEYETSWERRARIEKEKKEAAAAAEVETPQQNGG